MDGEQVARVVRALIYSFLASSQTQLLDFSVLHVGFGPSLPSMFPKNSGTYTGKAEVRAMVLDIESRPPTMVIFVLRWSSIFLTQDSSP